MTSIPVLLIHRDEQERARLRSALEAMDGAMIAAERTDLRAGLAAARQAPPAILVVELPAAGDTLAQVAQYKLEHPDVAIFLSAESLDSDTLLRALHAGAQEVLRRPLDRVALREAVERVQALTSKKNGSDRNAHSVITVFSNKGGSGVSTVATNLAFNLQRLTGRETVLADLDYHWGDAAFMLGLTPLRSLADVLAAPAVDSASVQAGLMRHDSGLHVLSQPDHPERAESTTPQQVGPVLEILASTFDLVVVDTAHVFNDVTLEVFDRSSTILIVTELSISSVRAARRSLEVFHKLNYTATEDRVRLIVNRHSRQSAITNEQVAETLQFPVYHHVANDYTAVSMAINVGRPVCSDHPESPAARDLVALAQKLVPSEIQDEVVMADAAPRRPGRLRLFRKG